MAFILEESERAGYFKLDGVDYPKNSYSVKYENIDAGTEEMTFTLYSIFDESNLISSRKYSEISGVASWAELNRLLIVLSVLGRNSASGISSERLPMYQFFDQIGDGTGNDVMNVNGETTPVSFKIIPPAGKIYGIARLIFSLRDSGSMDSGGWGNRTQPLNNGNKLIWHKNGIDIDLTRNPIASHFDLAGVCHDLIHANWGAGDEFITARFTFTKAGQYIILNGDEGDYLEVLIQDDLTYLVSQKVSAQGYQI